MDYQITVTLTDDQVAGMEIIATKAEKTVKQILEEFYTGYTVDEVFVKGAAMNQIDQWIDDEIKGIINKTDKVTILAKLNAQ